MATSAILAAHAAKAAATARTRILDAFRVRGATAPERALPLLELGLAIDDRYLAEFIRSGIIRGVDSRDRPVVGYELTRIGGYYLDEHAFIAERERTGGEPDRRRRKALLVVALVLVALLFPLIFLRMVAPS